MRCVGLLCLLAALVRAEQDPYLAYLREAPEFRPVAAIPARTADWLYMPWRHRWKIGTGDEGGRFCLEYGINGGFIDHGRGPIAWHERWGLRFYNDHTAGKGTLYLRNANRYGPWKPFQNDPEAIRPVPLDASTLEEARARVRRNLRDVVRSPMRWAYALDDEVSWGVFVRPMCWRLNEDAEDYARWLQGIHGREVEPRYVTADFTRKQLGRTLAELDFSALLDRLSYQDSVFANFVGALVETANEVDPETPCGIVGAQTPNAWGGYDYAKLVRKVQFLEAYDDGSAPAIARSLGAGARLTIVSTHFGKEKSRGLNSWEAWSTFAHGQRGLIGWVQGWFEGTEPKPWLKEFAPVLRELTKLGPKTHEARWVHDGIALYYSHPSIQVSWVLDSEAHGSTWPNRGRDSARATSHLVRKAWEYLLNDAGYQYDFVAYDQVARFGVPDSYRVLILPACFALSDIESRRIREFAGRGGIVVADFMCGLFDQHGRGRTKGALDDLFGVAHDGSQRATDFFADRLWVETDQDRGYEAKRWSELLGTLSCELRQGFAVAEPGRKGPVRSGNAIYLNLSPQRYLQLREETRAEPRHREVFLGALPDPPALTVTGAPRLETIRWRKGGRTLLFVVQNPTLRADGSLALEEGRATVRIRFPQPVADPIDERTGESLGPERDLLVAEMDLSEALFLSYRD